MLPSSLSNIPVLERNIFRDFYVSLWRLTRIMHKNSDLKAITISESSVDVLLTADFDSDNELPALPTAR